MKRSECDNCKTLADADPSYGSAPGSWFSVSGGAQSGRYERPRDFCSPECAITYLETKKAQPVEEAVA